MPKPVLFASARPLERAENLNAIFSAYDKPKHFARVGSLEYQRAVYSGNHSLMVTDEFPRESPGRTIMIWHAIQGGKKIGYDQPHRYYNRLMQFSIDYIVTAGNGTVDMFAKCTGKPADRVLPLGLPRTDQYVGKHKGDGHTILADKRAYLFAPTFRDGEETPFPDIRWEYIDESLHDDEILAVKFHPYRDMIRFTGNYRHIVSIPSSEPSAPYLYDADVVITDYSSIMFDAYLLDKPVVLFEKTPGYTTTRGMYFSYPEEYCSRYATNEEELLKHLQFADGLNITEKAVISHVADMCDGHACERLIQLINRFNV